MITRHVSSSRHARAGITLTEILISILIMGVGLISLATLFPLGIVRLRSAARDTRSALLAESALADLSTRNLLGKSSFTNGVSNPWYAQKPGYGYGVNTLNLAGSISYDPWVQDLGSYGTDDLSNNGANAVGVSKFGQTGPGLPVCYDPFFRAYATNPNGPPDDLSVNTTPGVYPGQTWGEARFGRGTFLTGTGAAGLQRITNFDMTFPARATYGALPVGSAPQLTYNAFNTTYHNNMLNTVASIFASQDDIVTYSSEGTQAASGKSSLIPDMGFSGSVTRDFSYTWFFTGQRSDATNADQYDGSIVVCHNRALAVEPLVGGGYAPAGESTVRAIWGFGSAISPTPRGYSAGGDRSVLLYWPSTMPDPEIKIGGWIADVTYERNQVDSFNHRRTAEIASNGNQNIPIYEPQRCYWYQIVKRGDVVDGVKVHDRSVRTMTVQIGGSLKAKTLVQAAGGSTTGIPIEPATAGGYIWEESALIMPSVVNVFPKSVNAH